jgi:hypothetical protein
VKLSRKERDDMLFDCLIAEGITPWQARAVWCGVRGWAMVSGQK